MACNPCETNFRDHLSIVVSIIRSGSTATVFVQNQGRNVVLIRRIVLCASGGGATSTWYLRPPPEQIAWMYPLAYLEPGILANYYSLSNLQPGTLVQAQAEYIEIDGRARSCSESF